MIYSSTKQRGFSLVETLVYAAGTVLLLGLIVSALFYAYHWYEAAAVPARADWIGESVASRLTNELRSAISFDESQSQFDTDDGVITVNTKISTTTEMVKRFSLVGGRLAYQENGGPIMFLSSEDVVFSRFLLSKASTTVATGIRFIFDIDYSTRNGSGTKTYSGFAIFRNSYE